MSLVSVILPTRNRAHCIERAVSSVLAQTWTALELIVVDDGSTDHTLTLLQAFDDPRLKVLQHPGPGGAGRARNFGVEHAQGDILAFQDSDDEWLVDKLERQLEALNSQADLALVCCGYFVFSDNAAAHFRGATLRMQQADWDASNIYNFWFITPSWLLRREAFEQLQGFDISLPNLEDWEFAFRLFQQYKIMALDEPLLIKHGGDDSLNWIPQARVDSLEEIWHRHAAIWAEYPTVRARLLRELGHWMSRAGDAAGARKNLWAAQKLDPWSVRFAILTMAAYLGPRCYARLRPARRIA